MSQAKTSPTDLILSLQSVLHKPCRHYFVKILLGSLLTVGCISSWTLAGRQDKRYKKIYWFVARIGKQVDKIQDRLLRWLKVAYWGSYPIKSTSIPFDRMRNHYRLELCLYRAINMKYTAR